MKLSKCSILILLIIMPVQTWAEGAALIQTEPTVLDVNDRKLIKRALDKYEEGLSKNINLDLVKAKRAIGKNRPAFFKQGYKSNPIDDTYTHYAEVHCTQNPYNDFSWNCKNSGEALLFSNSGSEQTIWLQNIKPSLAIKVIEFLKLSPNHECGAIESHIKKWYESCEFNKEKMKTIKAIRVSTSYGNGNTYTRLGAGDDRIYPHKIYSIEPTQCEENLRTLFFRILSSVYPISECLFEITELQEWVY
jgi:hypothetical protein